MTAAPIDGAGQHDPVGFTEPVLVEMARSYVTTWFLGALLSAGMLADLAFGGLSTHLLAWVAAFIIVVGMDLTLVRIARSSFSLIVTPLTVSIGTDVLQRKDIEAVERSDAPCHRILGRRPGEGVPRGKRTLRLRLNDGSEVLVPSSDTDRLSRVLGFGVPDSDMVIDVQVFAGGEFDGELDGDVDLVELWDRACTLFTVSKRAKPSIDGSVAALVTAVAFDGRTAVGYARAIAANDGVVLQAVAVLPSHLQRGIGAELVEEICIWAREAGHVSIAAVGVPDAPWCRGLMRSAGFTPLPAAGTGAIWRRPL